jgi:hypothetical protein
MDHQARRGYFRGGFSPKNGELRELSRAFLRKNRPKRAGLAQREAIPDTLLVSPMSPGDQGDDAEEF